MVHIAEEKSARKFEVHCRKGRMQKTVQTKFNVMIEKVMPLLHPLKILEMEKCHVNLQNVQRLNIGSEEHQKK